MTKKPTILLKYVNGQTVNVDYFAHNAKLQHLTPLRFETFLKIERIPCFTMEMITVFSARAAHITEPRMLTAETWDQDEVVGNWAGSAIAHMLRLAALRAVRRHPEVQRFVDAENLRHELNDPRVRHEFVSRYAPRDMPQAEYYCGYYPEEMIEFLEHRRRWGTKRIVLTTEPDLHMFCFRDIGETRDYLPLHPVNGQWAFIFSGLPHTSKGCIEQMMTLVWGNGQEPGDVSTFTLTGPISGEEWTLSW